MTTPEERSEMNTVEFEPRFRLRTPIRGRTGAEIVGYHWVSHLEEGMFADRRVSSWEDAQTSVPTGRKIVHLYWVRMPDTDEIILMGVGAAKKALGLTEAKLYGIAKAEAAAQRYWKDIWDREANKPYHGSAREARQAWTTANWRALSSSFLSESEKERKFDEASAKIKLLHRDGRWLLTSEQERIYELGLRGWEIVSGGGRTESNPPQGDWVFAKDYNIYDDAELMDEVETAAQDAVLEDNEAIIIPAPMFTASWKDYPYEALHETTCRAVERHCSRHARFTGEGEELEDGRIRMYLRYPGGLR